MASATFKVSFFNEDQLKVFMRLLRAMQYCGSVGHSTSFNVGVDGDGRFCMDVEVTNTRTGETTNLRNLVECNSEIYEQAKKDFKKWCPDSKDELAFGFE